MKALAEFGPMTAAEIGDVISYSLRRVHGITQRLKTKLPTAPKRIYISGYVFDGEGLRRYPRPVFALGDLPDKPKPKSDPAEIRRRYETNKKKRVNSVWMLGMSRDLRRKHGKSTDR